MTTLEWIVNNIQLPKGAKWNFKDRRWQLDIINDSSKRIVCRKPTQIGMSTIFLAKMLHFADTNQCRLLYTLPRQDDVYDMVNSRLHDIVTESKYINEKINEVDNVRMKKFGKSWLHFIEMSVPPRMLDADWMLNDEVDLSNQQNLQQAISRLDASDIGIHHQISTPSIDGFGIDVAYEYSDKKQWMVKCAYCSHEQFMDWNINLAQDKSGAYYKCARCSNRLHSDDIRDGRWIATGNTNSDISGYQISQLIVPSITPDKLLREYHSIDRKYFFNFRLGLPYTPNSMSFDKTAIQDTCYDSNITKQNYARDNATYVMGVDQGNILHICVMRLNNNIKEIVYLTNIDSFDELKKIIKRFKIRCGILDALPNRHNSLDIVGEFPSMNLAVFSQVDIYRFSENKANISKPDGYDMLLQHIIDGKIRFYTNGGAIPPEVDMANAHLCNMRRDMISQESRTGGVYRFHTWRNVGPDHYADAILYADIAAEYIMDKKSLMITDFSEIVTDNNEFEKIVGIAQESVYIDDINHYFPDNPYLAKKMRYGA